MLATDADLNKLSFPLLASAKLDGVRAVVRGGVVYSRSNKPIPNAGVQAKFKHLEYFDGELICGDPTSTSCYRDTVSVVMSHNKPADKIQFFVFDYIEHQDWSYSTRMSKNRTNIAGSVTHTQKLCSCLEDVFAYEQQCLDRGYEGLILRSLDAPYKNGRSTVKEGYLLKLKRMQSSEAVIIGFEERQKNNNARITNELGRGAKLSQRKQSRP